MDQAKTRLLAALSTREYERLAPFLRTADLKNGETLLHFGAPIEQVYFPHNCVTSTVVDTPEGSTIEVGLMGGEGLVGLSLLHSVKRSSSTVIVQIPGSATIMSANDFEAHIVSPRGEAFTLLMRYADAFMAMVAQTAACNSLHSIEQRLARWILMTHDRVRASEMPLTQEFLSYMLGVRRASVSTAAAEFQERGLITYTRGRVTVLNREALEKSTCACYGIVREIMDELLGRQQAA